MFSTVVRNWRNSLNSTSSDVRCETLTSRLRTLTSRHTLLHHSRNSPTRKVDKKQQQELHVNTRRAGLVGNFYSPLFSSGYFLLFPSVLCYATFILSRSIFRRLSVLLEKQKDKGEASRHFSCRRRRTFACVSFVQKNETKRTNKRWLWIKKKKKKISMFNGEMNFLLYMEKSRENVYKLRSMFRKRWSESERTNRKINKSGYDQFMTARIMTLGCGTSMKFFLFMSQFMTNTFSSNPGEWNAIHSRR